MDELAEAFAYYDRNYDLIGQWTLAAEGERIVLGDQERRRCRFCGRTPPQATFKDVAHAIPELLGNRTLFSAEECDSCNHFFGDGVENHLGNWSKPVRTFSRLRGKSGVPALKRGSSGGWRIEWNADQLVIKDEDDPVHQVDEEAKTLTLRLRRDTHIPAEVLKAFVKIGVTLLPAEELDNFKLATAWLLQSELRPAVILRKLPIMHTFRPGPMPDGIVAFMLRRKAAVDHVPYAFLVLSYGNDVFQVPMPSERDNHLDGQQVPMCFFPFPMPRVEPDVSTRIGQQAFTLLDMASRDPVKDAMLEVVLNFDDVTELPPDESAGAAR